MPMDKAEREQIERVRRRIHGRKPSSRNLASIIRSHFGPDNGVDLELPPRDTGREPPTFD